MFKKAIKIVLLIFVGLPISVIVLFLMYLKAEAYFSIRGAEFDSKLWKSETVDRCPMVAEVRDNYLQIGMPKNEVLELLGQPTNGWTQKENCIAYPLSYCSAWLWDPLSLRVCFNEYDKLIEAFVMQH